MKKFFKMVVMATVACSFIAVPAYAVTESVGGGTWTHITSATPSSGTNGQVTWSISATSSYMHNSLCHGVTATAGSLVTYDQNSPHYWASVYANRSSVPNAQYAVGANWWRGTSTC
jgi:hypothetical protein